MTENTDRPQDARKPLTYLIIGVAALAYLISRNPQATWHTFMMLLGFGAVIFVHELGHFIAAKSVGIKVEAFSLGFGWVVLGIRRVAGGYRVRLLPDLIPSAHGEGALGFTIPAARAVEGETEYRLSLIPLGGFVKMLGQEDMVEEKPSDDPRAYPNKPVWQRCVVISAGVVMNVIVGSIVFMIVFAHGIDQIPAVVGDAVEGKPAFKAGMRAGDEIIAINGETDYLSFMDVSIAGALADKGEKVAFTVRHPDGSQDTYHVVPQLDEQRGMRLCGIAPGLTRTIDELPEGAAELRAALAQIGWAPGDTVVAINGTTIEHDYQLHTAIFPKTQAASPDKLTLTVEDADGDRRDIDVAMSLEPAGSAPHVGRVLGMSPRILIQTVAEDGDANEAGVLAGDVVTQIGSIPFPTIEEMTQTCQENAGITVELTVLREEQGQMVAKVIEVTPRAPELTWWKELLGAKGTAMIGVGLGWDLTRPVVAHCDDYLDDQPPLPLPSGAEITTIAGNAVQNWEQIINALRDHSGREVTISYRDPTSQDQQSCTVNVPDQTGWIGFAYRPDFGGLIDLPWQQLKRMYKAENWTESLRMGAGMTGSFITQTYMTIRGMLSRNVSPKNVQGPVGILKMTYTVAAERSFLEFCYFMAMINVLIAIFNFLPLPVLDGGHMVFLLVEKFKGSPVSPKVQINITYVGAALLGAFVLFVTFNDIMRFWK